MYKPRITIFTATYNRGYIIEKLYRSLQRQRHFNFDWLVIDDGSSDNTQSLFESWMKEKNEFSINYKKIENGGLIRALNLGVKLASGEYFCKVDSDDFLTDDYIEKVNMWIQEIHNNENVYAVAGVRGTPDFKPMKGVEPSILDNIGYIDATDLERPKYNLDSEMCEIYKLNILRQFTFPVWKNEKFAPEQITFFEIALQGYKIRWHKDIICICEYRDDGLTKGANTLIKKNPNGYAMMYNHMLKYDKPFKFKFSAAAQHIALSIVGNNPKYILRSNKWWITLLALPLGLVLSLRRRVQFSRS